jgi:hypothetical protein
MLHKYSAATTDKTVCLVPSTEHSRNVLIDKMLGEDGQIVFNRQYASKFQRTMVKLVGKASHRTGAELFTIGLCPLLNHEAESSQMRSFSLRALTQIM